MGQVTVTMRSSEFFDEGMAFNFDIMRNGLVIGRVAIPAVQDRLLKEQAAAACRELVTVLSEASAAAESLL